MLSSTVSPNLRRTHSLVRRRHVRPLASRGPPVTRSRTLTSRRVVPVLLRNCIFVELIGPVYFTLKFPGPQRGSPWASGTDFSR